MVNLTLDRAFPVCYCFYMLDAAVMDQPPAVNGTGPTGAPEGSPHKPSLGEKLGVDINKGAERRKDTSEKIGRFFSSMKQKLNRGVDTVFAVPNIAGTLGGEVKSFASETASLSKDALIAAGKSVAQAGLRVNNSIVDTRNAMVKQAQDMGDVARGRMKDAGLFAMDKAEQAKNSVIEEGLRVNNNIVDTRERWVKRTQDAGDVVRGRVKEAGYAAGRRTVEIGRKAAGLGLISLVPIANRIDAVLQIPTEITQLRADSNRNLAEDLNARAAAGLERGEARAAALKQEYERVQKETEARFASMGRAQAEATRKAQELSSRATEARAKGGVFGRVRNLATALLAA